MAKNKCSSCGANISSNQRNCPYCGAENENYSRLEKIKDEIADNISNGQYKEKIKKAASWGNLFFAIGSTFVFLISLAIYYFISETNKEYFNDPFFAEGNKITATILTIVCLIFGAVMAISWISFVVSLRKNKK